MGAYGLRTQIWSNNWKSIALLAGFPFLLLLLLFGFSVLLMAFGGAEGRLDALLSRALYALPGYIPFALAGSAIWFGIAWAFHQNLIDAATGARPVSRKEQPELYNLLENLCISRGMPVPTLRIIDTPVRNAYASGLRMGKMSVTLTRGLIETLEPAEIKAVIGHELTHIRNRDVRLLVVSIIFVGIFSFVGQLVFRGMYYGSLGRMGRSRRSGGGNAGALMLVAFAIIAISWALAVLIRFALSRRREFLADAGSVDLTRNPDAMISALRKIAANADLTGAPGDVKSMFIENPAASGGLGGLFSTHPPLEKRIEALVMMGGRDPGLIEVTPPKTKSGPWDTENNGPWG
jgi:heat shock protein HtpX